MNQTSKFCQCFAILFVLQGSLACSSTVNSSPYSLDPVTVTFIEPQKPLLLDQNFLVTKIEQHSSYVDFHSINPKDFQKFDGYYICLGAFTNKVLDKGNFHIASKMGVIRDDPDQRPFSVDVKIGTQWYEFEISSGHLKLLGILLDAARYMPTYSSGSAVIPTDGSTFNLELIRQGSRMVILVNKKVLHEIPDLELTGGTIGFTIERPKILRVQTYVDPPTTLRIYEFKATGCIRDKTEAEVTWYNKAIDHFYMKRTGNAFGFVSENPDLPRVLLVGDSISIYYTDPVRRILAGKANVYRTPGGPGKLKDTLDRITLWLDEEKQWDLIHFNFGLHEFARKEGTQEDLIEYRKGLEKVIERLRKTGAHLVWASTTPVPPAVPEIASDNSNCIKYNTVAKEIMDKYGIPIDDLYAAMLPYHSKYWQGPRDIHFNREGSTFLGLQVAGAIIQELETMERQKGQQSPDKFTVPGKL